MPIPTSSRSAGLWFWSISTVLTIAYVAALRWTWIDDAMITLTYARNLAEGSGFSLVPGVVHYGFTSPLNVLLLAAVGLVVGFDHAITGATVGLILLLVGGSRCLSRVLFDDPTPGAALAIAIACSPWVASTFGLELLLGAVLSVFLLGSWLRSEHRRMGFLLGLLLLTRPDYGTVAVAALLLAPDAQQRWSVAVRFPWSSDGRPAWIRALCFALPPVLLWHLYSWIALGSALPMTFLIKLAQSKWGDFHFANGVWMYLRQYPLASVGSLLPLLALALLVRKPRIVDPPARAALAALVFGGAHFVGLAVLTVPPYHWYYVPSLTFALVAAWIAACRLPAALQQRRRLAFAFATLAFVPLGVLAIARGLPLNEAPIHSNWATHRDYREMARWLADNLPDDQEIQIRGEIGTLAYYSGLRLADPFSHPAAFPDLLHKAGHGQPTRHGRVKAVNFLFHPGARPLTPTWCIDGRRRTSSGAPEPIRSWTFQTSWSPATTWTVTRCARAPAP